MIVATTDESAAWMKEAELVVDVELEAAEVVDVEVAELAEAPDPEAAEADEDGGSGAGHALTRGGRLVPLQASLTNAD